MGARLAAGDEVYAPYEIPLRRRDRTRSFPADSCGLVIQVKGQGGIAMQQLAELTGGGVFGKNQQ